VVTSLNASDDGASPIIVVTEVALVDGSGNPVNDKAGNRRVCKLAACAQVIDKDSCRDLFITASNCKIVPPDGGDADRCIKDRTATWYDQNESSLDNSCP
jgi:hypothetical protein